MAERKKQKETKGSKSADSSAELTRGVYAYEGLDRVVHEKARLGILTALVTQPEGHFFNHLKDLCSLTDGNLSRHIQVLNDAGLVRLLKSTERGRSKTLIRISSGGRKQFYTYLEQLEKVILAAKAQSNQEVPKEGRAIPPGFAPA